MSTTIDSKVVEMRFDNDQFERNVSQSISSLDMLKASLDFSGLSGSISAIGSGISDLGSKFSPLGEVWRRVWSDIGDIAFTTIASIQNEINSLSFGQIIEGFNKYTLVSKSVQTIMAATRKEWSDQNAQMEYVTEQIQKLNWFTDETSYNLVDMTSNIGKFVASGVALDDAVSAMMGIATWAGLSGANIQQASNAMYNLSQAMGVGYVRVIDWMSIENANMATKEFREEVLKTAAEVGTLKALANGAYEIVGTGKPAKKNRWGKITKAAVAPSQVTAETLRSTLKDKWLNNEVLTKVLKSYGDFSEQLYYSVEKTQTSATEMLSDLKKYKATLKDVDKTAEVLKAKDKKELKKDIKDYLSGFSDLTKVAEKYGVSVEDLTENFEQYRGSLLDLKEVRGMFDGDVTAAINYRKALDDLSSSEYDVGYAAMKASQESRTLEDSIVATKDAVSSGYMKIFTEILGNYLESVELWSTVSEELWHLFVEDLDNTYWLVKEWGELGGREILLEGVKNAWEAIKEVIDTVKGEISELFPAPTAEKLITFTEKFRDWTKELKLSDLQLLQIRTSIKYVVNVLTNVWTSVKRIFNAIKTAFTEIFPQTKDAIQIVYEIARGTSKLSDKLAITEERADKIRRIFKGLFAVMDIVLQLIKAIIKPFANLDDTAVNFGDSVLDIAAGLGDWLANLDKLIKDNDVFGKSIEAIIGFFNKLKDSIDGLIYDLTNKHLDEIWEDIKKNASAAAGDIKKFFGMFTSGESDNAEKKGITLAGIFEKIAKFIEDVKKAFKDAQPYIDQISDTLSETFQIDFNNWEDFKKIFREGGALALIGAFVYDFWRLLQYLFIDAPEMIFKAGNAFTAVLDGIGESFWQLSQRIRAGTLTKIARAMLYMAVAIALIAAIKTEKLNQAIGVIAGMFAMFLALFNTFEKYMKSDAFDAVSLLAIAKAFKGMGFAILEIAVGLAVVAKAASSGKDITKAAEAIGALMIVMAGILGVMGKYAVDTSNFSKISAAIAGLSFAMIEIAAALAIVISVTKGTKNDELLSAVEALGGMMVAIGAFLVIISKVGANSGTMLAASASIAIIGFALIEIAAALAIVVAATKGTINGELESAVEALGALIIVLALFFAVVAKANVATMLAAAVSMAIIGAALVEMAAALYIVSEAAKSGELDKGLENLIYLLAGVTIALIALTKLSSGGDLLAASVAITIASAGILLLATALKSLVGINDFTPVIIMGSALLVLIAAAALAEKVSSGLLTLGIALALIGVGALAAGAGMLKFAEGVEKLVSNGKEGVDNVIYFIEQLGHLLPNFLGELGKGLLNMISVIFIDGSAILLDALTNLIAVILQAVIILTPLLVEVGKQLFLSFRDLTIDMLPILIDLLTFIAKELLRSMVTVTPMITEAALAILLDTLNQIAANIGEITKLLTQIALEILLGTIEGITAEIPHIVEVLWNFIIVLIESIAAGLDAHAEDLRVAVIHLAQAMIDAFCTFLGIESPSTVFEGFGDNIVQGLINGVVAMIGKAVEIFWDLADKLLSEFCKVFGIEKNGTAKEMFDAAVGVVKSWIDGIAQWIGKAVQNIKDFADGVLTKFCEMMGIDKPNSKEDWSQFGIKIIQRFNAGIYSMFEKAKNMLIQLADLCISAICKALGLEKKTDVGTLYNTGKQMIQGFIDGIVKKGADLTNKAKSVVNEAVKAIKKLLGINSPSKLFMQFGEYVDEGFIQGLLNYASDVADAAADVGDTAISGIMSAISSISDMVDSEMGEPTIRPVLDLSDVVDGIDTMDGMLSTSRSVDLAAGSSISMNNRLADKNNEIAALASLRDTLSGKADSEGTVNNNNFYITGDDPKAIAEEVSRILQRDVERNNQVWV